VRIIGYNWIMRVNMVKIICVVLAFIAISAFFHFYFEKEGDPDIFYHFKHAEIYTENGIFYNEFPWLPYTIIGQNNSDQWYGFHLLLIPFTYFQDRIFGLKLAGAFITTAFLLMFYFALQILKTGREFFWTLFMFFSAPPVFFHLLLIRPHVISTGLAALLFAMLVAGYGNISVFAVSLLVSWLHPNLFWLPILIVGVMMLLGFYREKKIMWQNFFSVLGGIFVGLLLTPNPIDTIKTIITNVFGSVFSTFSGISLDLGKELKPVILEDAWIFLFFLAIWAVVFLKILNFKKRYSFEFSKNFSGIAGASALSVIFFLMAILLVRRAADLWIVFGTIFIAIILGVFLESYAVSDRKRIATNSFLMVMAFFIVIFGGAIYASNIELFGWDGRDFEAVSRWLSDNSRNQDIIVNASWDYFPFLFFWNSKNYYASGVDPIFLYAANKRLWAEAEILRFGDVSHASQVLKDFGSEYIFVTKQNESKLYNSLLKEQNFIVGFEDAKFAVFKLKTSRFVQNQGFIGVRDNLMKIRRGSRYYRIK